MRFDGTPIGDAIAGLVARQEAYRLYKRYYEGEHDLQRIVALLRVRNRAFKDMLGDIRENLCPPVVDSIDDRLHLDSIDCGDEGVTERLTKALRVNRFDKLQTVAHRGAMVQGDFYVLAWKSPQGIVKAYEHEGHEMTVVRNGDDPDVLDCAVKMWEETIGKTKRVRLTLYYPDRIERYAKAATAAVQQEPGNKSWQKARTFLGLGDRPLGSGEWEPFTEGGPSVVRNLYGVVPVATFHNNAFHSFGTSELRDVIPLQNALNKSILDALVTGEATGIPQRYIAGFDWDLNDDGSPKTDLNKNLWMFADKDTKVGQIDAADVTRVIATIDDQRLAISRVTGVPAHYFMLGSGGWPSGEALKTAEARFTAKVKARQVDFGNSWEDLGRIMLLIEGVKVDAMDVEAKWRDTAPRNEKEHWEVQGLQHDLGKSKREIWTEEGWTEDQIEKMFADATEEGKTAAKNSETMMARMFASGGQEEE